uniref:Uncharacterized protein n=1 Tax=Panagrolaimus davidi TaxID=227884 RepID=A0A914QXN1_9BILA
MDYFFRAENKNEYQKYVGEEYDYDYYKWCWNEMKTFEEKWDWQNTESSEQYSNLKKQIKKIKSIINYKLMVEIFGENDISNEDENLYNLKEFQLLSYDGNARFASACNKEDYIGFGYGTS